MALNDDSWSLTNFAGETRLFPLPNVVMFPHVVQPLHVFEQRYRDMTADALASDQLITMCLLQPNWEPDYDGRPSIHPIACLGRIITHNQLDDGRYVMLLRGLNRVRIIEELPSEKLYRMARVELMHDVSVMTLDESRAMRKKLSDLIMPRVGGTASDKAKIREMFEGETSLGTIADTLCYQMSFALERKLQLLEETDVSLRTRALIELLEAAPFPSSPTAALRRKYPPDFSEN